MKEKGSTDSWREKTERDKVVQNIFFEGTASGRHANIQTLQQRFANIARAIENGAQIDLGDGKGIRKVQEIDKDLLIAYVLRVFEDENVFPTSEVIREYFEAHTQNYCDQINRRVHGSEHLVGVDTKVIVSIAARNELGLEKALKKLEEDWENTHGSDTFSQQVAVVVFNNYPVGDTLPSEAQDVLDRVKKDSNVHLTSEELDTLDTNAGIPKKIATDMALRICQKAGFFPELLCIDADLADLQEGTLDTCLDTLRQPGILAVSPDYDYEPASKEKFPLWGLRCELVRHIRRYDMSFNPTKRPRIIGGLYCMKLKTLALMGGVPAEKNQDLGMTITLQDLFSIYWFNHEPIGRPPDQDAVAYFNPSKELQNILAERSPESHWHDAGIQREMSGKPRLRWEDMDCIDGTLLAKSIDKDGVALLIQDVWSSVLEVIPNDHHQEIALQMYSSRFLRACYDLDIDLSAVTFRMSNGETLSGDDQILDFLDRFDTSENGTLGRTYQEIREYAEFINGFTPEQLTKVRKYLEYGDVAFWSISSIEENQGRVV
jgi:hypothetical protein